MQTWTTKDKSNWGQGAWQDEPDKAHWIDEASGLDCLIVRGPGGALCGYVGVPPEHKLFRQDCDDVWDKYRISPHGGLTFSGLCDQTRDTDAEGICHPEEGCANKIVWWLGFDCAHYGDVAPAMDRIFDWSSVYRPFDYVKRETEQMAKELGEI